MSYFDLSEELSNILTIEEIVFSMKYRKIGLHKNKIRHKAIAKNQNKKK